jgi:hypothetical protein
MVHITCDADNATAKRFKKRNLNLILFYQVTDNVGNLDLWLLTVTINGVTEPPVATNNTNNVTRKAVKPLVCYF